MRHRATGKVFSVVGLIAALAAALVWGGAPPALADDTQDARHLVEKASSPWRASSRTRTWAHPARHPQAAKGVLIYPRSSRGLHLRGRRGQRRDAGPRREGGALGRPRLLHHRGGQLRPADRGEAMEVVLVALTERGVSALLTTSAKLGANVASRRARGGRRHGRHGQSQRGSRQLRARQGAVRGHLLEGRWWRRGTD